jgi:hypothetical protein
MARPIPTSAAAIVIIKIVKIWPCINESASIESKIIKLIFTAFNINSIERRTITALRLTRMPYIPREKRAAAVTSTG